MEIISAWELYLWTRLDAVGDMLFMATIVSMFGFLFFFFCTEDTKEGETDKYPGKKKYYVISSAAAFLVFCFLSVAIPSKKDMAMIYVIPKLANSEVLQVEAKEIYDIAKGALKEYVGAEAKEND